jgi:hypothetical protein
MDVPGTMTPVRANTGHDRLLDLIASDHLGELHYYYGA